VLSGNAVERIENSALEELVITDTIPQTQSSPKIRVVPIGNLFAAVMHKVNSNESISGHFVM
jgi:ribose-phosphate pyrophosphokinase